MMKHLRLPLFYSLLSLSILGPLLGRGYILTLDMVFTPKLRMPQDVTSSYLFHALLHYLNAVVPADIIQKLLLMITFVAAGWGMHRLIAYLQQAEKFVSNRHTLSQITGRIMGSCLYIINPFTYERLMAGQYAVLLGYALLPWFTRGLLVYLRQPTWIGLLQPVLLAVGVGIVSIHSLGPIAVIAGIAIAGMLFRHGKQVWKLYGWQLLGGVGAFALLSSYWLFPLLAGSSKTAQQVGRFGEGDRLAFATSGSNLIEKLVNALQLRGFWTERHELFTLPWSKLGATWYLLSLGIIGLVVLGLVSLWRAKRVNMAIFLTVVIIAGALCASGLIVGSALTQGSLLAGFREPQKFAMLIALGYSVGLAFGITTALAYWSDVFTSWPSHIVGAAVCIALPFMWTFVMLWGCNGQLAPRQFPVDWFAVNDKLNQLNQKGDHKTLFLPWHLYMHTDFAGRTIANPAPAFFDSPVTISDDPELPDAAIDKPSDFSRQVDHLLRGQSKDHKVGPTPAGQLEELGVDYIILAKENDYRDYQAITDQPGVETVIQTPTINLYHLQAKQEPSYVPTR